MLKSALLLCAKDLRLTLARGSGLIQALLLGLLLIFVFSLSQDAGEKPTPQAAAAMFWLASAFCQVLVFNTLYAVEETGNARMGLLLMPAPLSAIWLGKALAGLLLILLSQLVFVPAVFVFLGQPLGLGWQVALLGLLLTDIGMASCGSLLGALSVGQSGRESLMSIVLFPLMIPLLLAGIRTGMAGFTPLTLLDDPSSWLGIALAFDALFAAAGLILFPFVYSGED